MKRVLAWSWLVAIALSFILPLLVARTVLALEGGKIIVKTNPDKAGLVITAKRVSDGVTYGPFTRSGSQYEGTVPDDANNGLVCPMDASRPELYNVNITVKDSTGTTLGTKANFSIGDICNAGRSRTASVDIKNATEVKKLGTFAGKIEFTLLDGTKQPFKGTSTQYTLTGGPTTGKNPTERNDDGTFKYENILQPGTYTFDALYSYTATAGGTGVVYKVHKEGIVIKAGETTNLNLSAECSADANCHYTSPPESGGTAPPDATCESAGALAWVICPVIKIVDETTSYLDNQVISLLQVPEKYYSGNKQLEATWERIRNLALLIIIPVMLFMVLSTAMGFSFIDAYTIKRALPRAVAAVMFIVLSWSLMVYLMDITNDVGSGILGLLTGVISEPGGASRLTLSNMLDPSVGLGLTLGVGAGAGIFGFLVATGGIAIIGIVLLQALAVLMGLVIAFMVLVLRQMLLITLLILSPLAILSWIFPNNNKLWKLWWESFSKLLLMFPIIMVFIAAGRIFAFVISGTATGIAGVILVIFAYIIPYFLIPATFKMAGGVFATITGAVNNRKKGLFDRNKNMRNKLWTGAKKDMGDRFKGGKGFRGLPSDNKWNKRLQQLSHMGSVGDKGIKGMFSETVDENGVRLRGWKSNIRAAIEGTEKAHAKHAGEDELLNTWAMLDDASGPGEAILKNRVEGIRDRLKMLGVGTKHKWVEGVDGAPGKWVVDKDKDGNTTVVDETLLAAKTKEISDLMDKGDREGAYRQALISTGTFGTRTLNGDGTVTITDQDMGQIDAYTSHFMRDSRRFGDEVLAQVLVKKAAAGGTYYSNAAAFWAAADSAVGHDGSARGEMSATARSINTNAGRVDIGGASHGTAIKFMADLHEAEKKAKAAAKLIIDGGGSQEQADAAYRVELDSKNNKLQVGFSEHVWDNTPGSVVLNQIMKEGFIDDNLLTVFANRVEKAAGKAQNKGTDSVEYAEYQRLLADADSAYQTLLNTKPALALKFGKTVMDRDLVDNKIKMRGVRVKKNDAGERVTADGTVLGTDEKDVMEEYEYAPDRVTVRTANEHYRPDPVRALTHREWTGTQEFDGARMRGGAPDPGSTVGSGLPKPPVS